MKMVNLWPTNILHGEFNSGLYMTDYLMHCRITEHIRNEYENFLDGENFKELKDLVLKNFKHYLELSGIDKSFKSYDVNSWAINFTKSNSMVRHNHKNSHLSAVYYFMTEDTPGGELVLHDPRGNANRGYPSENFKPWFDDYQYKPKEGEFIIFPSFMYHSVTTFLGNVRKGFVADLFLKI